jgi:hypothetical protein
MEYRLAPELRGLLPSPLADSWIDKGRESGPWGGWSLVATERSR